MNEIQRKILVNTRSFLIDKLLAGPDRLLANTENYKKVEELIEMIESILGY